MKTYRIFIIFCLAAIIAIMLWPHNSSAKINIYSFETGLPIEKYQKKVDNAKVDTSKAVANVYLDTRNNWGYCNSDIIGATAYNGYYFKDDVSYKMFWVCLYHGKYPKEINKTGTFFHELGHVYDETLLTDAKRRKFKKIMRINNPVWMVYSDYDFSPNEWFADAFMWCAYRPDKAWIKNSSQEFYGYFWPTKRQLKAICRKVF